MVALGKPSDREQGAWYFQRYVPHLPIRCEFVLFNRSWYNRAGVEWVMGAQYEEFMETVLGFEQMLVRSGIRLLKYLDVSKAEQRMRLNERAGDPLVRALTRGARRGQEGGAPERDPRRSRPPGLRSEKSASPSRTPTWCSSSSRSACATAGSLGE